MPKDASAALGAPEVAGTLVSTRGVTNKMTTRTGDVPSFGRIGYLAASETELVITKTSQLGFTPHATGDALARVPRGEVETVAMRQGRLLSRLTLTFGGGVTWDFEVPRVSRKGAADFVAVLGGTVT
jgi:hypothetical protein